MNHPDVTRPTLIERLDALSQAEGRALEEVRLELEKIRKDFDMLEQALKGERDG